MKNFVAGLLVALAGASPALADNVRQVHDIMRDLRDGIVNAQGGQASDGALKEFAELVAREKERKWDTPRERRAIALYLFARGAARPVRAIVEATPANAEDKKVLEGALAFAERRNADALQALAQVDARAVSADIAVPVAMTQARLSAPAEPGDAMAFFDMVRLLSPGSMWEEAALLEQLAIASRINDARRFASIARRFFGQFSKFPRVAEFQAAFSRGFEPLWIKSDQAAREELEGALDLLSQDMRVNLLLTAVRNALIGGDADGARRAARVFRRPGFADDRALVRAEALAAEADSLQADGEAALEKLSHVDVSRLPIEERLLRECAKLMAERIRSSPEAAPLIKPTGADSPLVTETEARVAAADAMIGALK